MLPIVAVEASMHGIPGEGWRKAYQFTIPLLYLSAAAAVFSLLPTNMALWSWRAVAGCLAALTAAATLGINRLQVEITRSEKNLRDGLFRLARENFESGYPPPYEFVVRLGPDVHWYASGVLAPAYARTWKFPKPSSFRILPGPEMTDPRFSLKFTADGVQNAEFDGATIRDAHVFPVSFTDREVRRLCSLGPQEVKSPVVEWDRSTPLQSSIGVCGGKGSVPE
jgi:hypothetical protein